jgi:hypothetical protein
MTDRYVIQSVKCEGTTPHYWSGRDGWVTALGKATRYKNKLEDLPIDGVWVLLPDVEGKCPECGEELDYDVLEPTDGNLIFYPVHCRECGWVGKEWYEAKFTGHDDE